MNQEGEPAMGEAQPVFEEKPSINEPELRHLREVEWHDKDAKMGDKGRGPLASLYEGILQRAWKRGEISNTEKLMLAELIPAVDAMVHVYRMGRKVGLERGRKENILADKRVQIVRDMLGKDSPL